MNLADLPGALSPKNAPVITPPPPPPVRPKPKRPSCDSGEAALRSPLRERKKNQNFNFARYPKYANPGAPVAPVVAPPPPPPALSPKKPITPPISPKPQSLAKSKHDNNRRHQKDREKPKKEESPESSQPDTDSNPGSAEKGKSPLPAAKSPAARLSVMSEADGNQDSEKTTAPLVFVIFTQNFMDFFGDSKQY
ncbi:hypothetical protein CRE_02341 [Caenorhabditis remanei]|uniref:Uncharacterized protein n=1 Tax=Caenorhabditis remanei TaxID=31234 RepID=E3MIK3_CAERE|nr:hypothetical protein CRE_02341 [Caenorhabditis remanei]